VADRTYCPEQPAWNADGTPANEDALQITAWIVEAVEQRNFVKAWRIWAEQHGNCTFPSAYPGIQTGVMHQQTNPLQLIEDTVNRLARTPRDRSRGIMGWRELLKGNMSMTDLYWRASPEVRAQIEDCIIVREDGPKAKVAKRAVPYIEQLRDYVATRERRDAADKAFMMMHEDDRAAYLKDLIAGLASGSNSLLNAIGERRPRPYGKASEEYQQAMTSKEQARKALIERGIDLDKIPDR
jgi:hypothetical protein